MYLLAQITIQLQLGRYHINIFNFQCGFILTLGINFNVSGDVATKLTKRQRSWSMRRTFCLDVYPETFRPDPPRVKQIFLSNLHIVCHVSIDKKEQRQLKIYWIRKNQHEQAVKTELIRQFNLRCTFGFTGFLHPFPLLLLAVVELRSRNVRAHFRLVPDTILLSKQHVGGLPFLTQRGPGGTKVRHEH